ncbi:MAG: hypothetical protein KME27_10730 [Lyngbya sp. HA4199-MV5]|jgi:hypothetical protein|nr:hypothetical protein [Lyngbya sp. HA4199-MV5]
MHHLDYRNLGHETYWWDVLVLSPAAHDWLIHGLLSGWKRPRQQKHYPNLPQRLAHNWGRLPCSLKMLLVAAIFVALGASLSSNHVFGGGLGALIFILVLWL